MILHADDMKEAEIDWTLPAPKIRAAFEKIILERRAELLPKPALFLCNRDEPREQTYTKLKAAFGGNTRIRGQGAASTTAQELRGGHFNTFLRIAVF